MNSEITTILANNIQKINIYATGAPSTSQLRTELLDFHKATGNWENAAVVVNDYYMNSQILFTQNGANG